MNLLLNNPLNFLINNAYQRVNVLGYVYHEVGYPRVTADGTYFEVQQKTKKTPPKT